MKTLFTFLFLIFHQFLIGATYYVSKDPCASNANDGLYANCDQGGIHGPFSTIQHAADVASAGDTVFIRGGTYDEKIDLLNYGSAGSPIVFMNYQNESPVIDWSGTVNPYHAIFEMRGTPRHIVISGLSIQNSEEYGILAYGNYSNSCRDIVIDSVHVLNSSDAAIYMENCCDSKVINSHTEESGASGIFTSHGDSITIIGNTIINARNSSSGHDEFISVSDINVYEVANNEVYYHNMAGFFGALGIDAKDGSSHGSIHHNYIHDITKDGAIYIDAYDNSSPGSVNNRIYQNKIENCKIGISVGTEEGGTVDSLDIFNNLIIDTERSGIQLHDSGPHGTDGVRKNINIYHNTIFSTVGSGWKCGIFLNINTDDPNHLSDIHIQNNIVRYHRKVNISDGYGQVCGTQILISNQSGMNIVVQKNLTTGIYYGTDALLTLSEMIANPLFVDSVNHDFHLQAISPAVDEGMDVSDYNINDDYDGVSRPLLQRFDLGAFESGIYWNGSINNHWDNAGNWSNNQVPSASDSITIPPPAFYLNFPRVNTNRQIKKIYLYGSSSLTVDENVLFQVGN